jgi:hypothetical protein
MAERLQCSEVVEKWREGFLRRQPQPMLTVDVVQAYHRVHVGEMKLGEPSRSPSHRP